MSWPAVIGKRAAQTQVTQAGTRALHASSATQFLVRSLDDVRAQKRVVTADKGGLESRRYLVRDDDYGFSLQQEVLKKGAAVRLEFRNHVYALLITQGRGSVRLLDAHGRVGDGQTHEVSEGSLVALNASEAVELEAETAELHAVSVMNPPLFGTEQRHEDSGVFPIVDPDGEELESYDHASVGRLFAAPESLKGGSAPMKDDPLF